MPISPTLPADGESNWDVSLNAALTDIIDEVNTQETAIAGKAATSHTHTASDVTDFAEVARDTLATALVAGANVTITPNDGADTITIAASGGGGGAVSSVNGATGIVVLTQDDVADGSTYVQFSATQETKLAGIATGATANSADATLLARANHTGTQSADTLTDGTTNKAFLATERTKLTGIATGATANDTDANLKARANHTGTQTASTISDFATTVRATTGSDTAAGSLELATDAEAVTGTDTARAVTPANVAAVVAVTRARYSAVNAQTGTTYAPVLSDEGKLVTLSNASAITVTMPQDSTTAFPVGATIDFVGIGAGLVTFSAGTGATVNPTAVTRAQWSAVTAIKRAANTWLIVGDIS